MLLVQVVSGRSFGATWPKYNWLSDSLSSASRLWLPFTQIPLLLRVIAKVAHLRGENAALEPAPDAPKAHLNQSVGNLVTRPSTRRIWSLVSVHQATCKFELLVWIFGKSVIAFWSLYCSSRSFSEEMVGLSNGPWLPQRTLCKSQTLTVGAKSTNDRAYRLHSRRFIGLRQEGHVNHAEKLRCG